MPKLLSEIKSKADAVENTWKGVAPAERAFVKKLADAIKLTPDPAKNGDDVFNASKLKRDDKEVIPGQDVKAYKEWNKPTNEEFKPKPGSGVPPEEPIPAKK